MNSEERRDGGESRKAGKRARREENVDNTTSDDKLTNLPEPILCHILSFLDTKSAVQTSVLSRAWRPIWKCVPVLDLHASTFKSPAKFDKFVSKVLSLRDGDLKLHKAVYFDNDVTPRKAISSSFVEVINYALSHEVQHLEVYRVVSGSKKPYCSHFSSIFSEYCNDKIAKKNNHLKTLDLTWLTLDRGFVACSGFPMLTTLIVDGCELDTDDRGLVFSANNFPCLENLVMANCFPERDCCQRRIKVYGPHLLSLKLRGMGYCEIEIFAPKLKFFGLCQDVVSKGFFDSALYALDRADIALTWKDHSTDKLTVVDHYLNSLLQYLHSAKLLTLDSSTIQILNSRCEFLEQQSSHFKRLESLILPSKDLHAKVIDYIFKGSTCEKPNIVV